MQHLRLPRILLKAEPVHEVEMTEKVQVEQLERSSFHL